MQTAGEHVLDDHDANEKKRLELDFRQGLGFLGVRVRCRRILGVWEGKRHNIV